MAVRVFNTVEVTTRAKWPCAPPPILDCKEEPLAFITCWTSAIDSYVSRPIILEIVEYGNPSTIFSIVVVIVEEVLITDDSDIGVKYVISI